MCQVPDNFVTSDLVNHLHCGKPKYQVPPNLGDQKSWGRARFMVVFEHGDLNTAAHCLAQDMHEPFSQFPIACVAVEESIRDDFIERLRHRFFQVKPHVATHPKFERSLNELKYGGIDYLVAPIENAPPNASPILVTDNITQLFFGSSPSGVVTLHTFETIKDISDAITNETPPFDAIYLFDESVTSVYSLGARVSVNQFFVNCTGACLMPILPFYGLHKTHAMLHNGMHYETIVLGGQMKIIVFPYASSILRRCCCKHGSCVCNPNEMLCCE
ncbi:CG5623 [Drosophila busckii]|uniref:CG5623 n=1 Tax=Drosophila busckii TaxID=30019 RepID=A0A0M3QY58_DROBS|nr:uncharacterized protein LOC108602400 [Drosophila busckii]ALC47103.1 CG5623 [Drosophila busckii]